MGHPQTDRNGVQVISRAAAILRCLEDSPGGMSLGAIATKSGLPRSTVQRLVDALIGEQLLELHARGGVALGPAFVRLAGHSHVDVVKTAAPFLEELSKATGETAVLVGLSGTELLVLQSVISDQALRVCPVVGNFLSVYATAGGKILLSGMDDEGVRELLNGRMERFTPKTPALDELLSQLSDVRSSGFATDFDEHTPGVGAIAVGLKTAQGEYAIDVVGPVWRMEKSMSEIRDALVICQSNLSKALRVVS